MGCYLYASACPCAPQSTWIEDAASSKVVGEPSWAGRPALGNRKTWFCGTNCRKWCTSGQQRVSSSHVQAGMVPGSSKALPATPCLANTISARPGVRYHRARRARPNNTRRCPHRLVRGLRRQSFHSVCRFHAGARARPLVHLSRLRRGSLPTRYWLGPGPFAAAAARGSH